MWIVEHGRSHQARRQRCETFIDLEVDKLDVGSFHITLLSIYSIAMFDWSHLNQVERSAVMTLLWRAAESRRADRLFTDKAAEEAAALFPPWPSSPLVRVFADIVSLRTSELDRRVSDAVAGGLQQIVIIGAGLDTRFTRLDLPSSAIVTELDSEAVNDLALKVLPKLPAVRREVALIPGGVTQALDKTSYNRNRPTLWIVEGVLEYLPGQLWKRLAAVITEHSAPRSRALITVLGDALPRLLAEDPTFPFPDLPSLTHIVSAVPSEWRSEVFTSARFREVPANAFSILSLSRSEPRAD